MFIDPSLGKYNPSMLKNKRTNKSTILRIELKDVY